jgi:hypothetical protein
MCMWRRRFRLDRYPIFQQIYGCGLTSEQLRRIPDEFGPLSEIGRKRLHLGIIRAVQSNWFSRLGKSAPASKLADRFRAIEDRVNELSSLLGARVVSRPTGNKPLESSWDLLSSLGEEIARVLIEEGMNNLVLQRILRVVPAEGRVVGGVPTEADELPIRVTSGGSLNLVRMTLTMLAEAASRAGAEARVAVSPGRGGARRKGRTPQSRLALDLISVYFETRRRYPNSGSAAGYSPGGPLPRFILAVFDAVAENGSDLKPIKDASVGELFYKFRKSGGTRE